MVDSSVFGASTRLFLLPSPLPSNKLELENGEIDVEEEDLRAVVSLETAKMRITNTHNQFHSLDEETQESPPTPFLDRSEINGSICMTPAFATPCLTHVCASLEHKEVLEATIISLNSVARNDSEPASKPKPNKTRSQQAIDSDCSLSTSSSSSSKTYSSSSPAPNYSRLKSKSSQKKSLNHCSRLNHHLTTDTEPILDKALQRVSSPSDCSPIYNQNSSQRSNTNLMQQSQKRSQNCQKKTEKTIYASSAGRNSSKHSATSYPTPPIFSPSIAIAPSTSFNHPKVAIQSPAITSTSSPTQPAVKPLHQQNLPPPGLIMPPTPVGLVPIRQPPLVKVEEVAGTPKPMSLEQRLNAMFKKGAIKKEKSNEIPIELVKLESPEDQNIKMEGHEENSPVIDLSMMSPSTSRVRDTIANHLVGSTSPRNPFRNRLMQIAKHDEVKQETQQEVESEQAKKARLDAQLVKERHQKIQRCVDVSRQARSTFSVEMIMVLHKDIQRRLEAEALKILDENTKLWKKKGDKKPSSWKLTFYLQPNTTSIPRSGRLYEQQPRRRVPKLLCQRPFAPYQEEEEQEEIQRKSSRRNQTRSSSELSEDKMVRKKSKGSQLVRRVLHKRSLSSSSSASRSSSNSSSICVSRRKRNDVSVNASSRISSADEAEPITDSEADEQEVQKSEQQIEKEKEKTLLDKKRAILDSLLKGNRDEEDDDSCSLQSSLTPPPECLPGDQTPKSTKPEVLENHRSAPSTPPPVKKAKTSKELASLLHSSSDFIAPQKPVVKKEPKVWALRDPDAELNLMHNFEISHLSSEDCTYFKLAILKLEPQFEEQVVKQPRELPAPIKKDKCEFYFDDHELEGIVPHKSGCARTEGFYKISKQRKTLMRRHEDYANRTIISTQDETAVRHMTQAAKDERAMNRRLLTWIGDSALVRVNQLKYRSKMIKFARSQIHGWGLYALETIPPEVMIIEYVGEKIRPTVADEREKSYELRGMGSSYMFRIDGDAVIDATKQGNFGRFINHSCSPNCTARVVLVDGDKRIVIYSKRLISKGEEITYDYKFAREEEASKIECLCGSKCCQKFLN
uniref:[histone H3]-lysine(4) N-trimethyltransferase n=1 Tax=Ditylenchus dipsaci TaxID=166011 RepID=A0A915DPS0_9BILA